MKKYFQSAKSYLASNKSDALIGAAFVVIIAIVAVIIVILIQNNAPKVVYQPTKACELLTLTEAKELLGPRTLHSNKTDPVVSSNTASSRCGYTDGNPDTNNMIVAAIIVRSAVNDNGMQENRNDFTLAKQGENATPVQNVGDEAFFNQKLGQLNILDGRDWIILSNGIGAAPELNTLEDVIKLAHKVIPDQTTASK